jgi:hypothetical protein
MFRGIRWHKQKQKQNKMKQLTEYKPNQNRALLLVGAPGTGKTTLLLHAPKPWIFDADNNMNGPVDYLRSTKYDLSGVSYDNGTIDDNGKEIPAFDRYRNMTARIKVAAANPEVSTLVFDGLTAIANFIKDDIRRQSAGKVTENDPLRIQDWELYNMFLRKLITTLRTVGKPCIFTAHQLLDKDEATGIYKTFIALQGQSKNTFAGLFSDVWNTYIKESGAGDSKSYNRMVRTMPTSSHDERGLKESMQLAPVLTQPEAIKILQRL